MGLVSELRKAPSHERSAGALATHLVRYRSWCGADLAGDDVADKNAYESIKAFSETDFTEDLKKFDVPTLVLHGEDDHIVPSRTRR